LRVLSSGNSRFAIVIHFRFGVYKWGETYGKPGHVERAPGWPKGPFGGYRGVVSEPQGLDVIDVRWRPRPTMDPVVRRGSPPRQ
jgi:hypothetical protein